METADMVQLLWDRERVVELTHRYASGVDRRDWEQVRSCFTDTATVEGSISGGPVDEYLRTIRTAVERYSATMHLMSNHDVEINGDRANAQTYAVAFHWAMEPAGSASEENLVAGVRYLDELVRVDSGWAVERRRVMGEWRRRGF